jgi:hypothetical protein
MGASTPTSTATTGTRYASPRHVLGAHRPLAGPKDALLPKRVGSADRNGLEGEAMSDKQTTGEDTKPVRTAPGDEAPPDVQSVG